MNFREPGEFGDGATMIGLKPIESCVRGFTIEGGVFMDQQVGCAITNCIVLTGASGFMMFGNAMSDQPPLAERYADFTKRLDAAIANRAQP